MATAPYETRPVDATYSGVPTNNITKGLPKHVESICPDPDCGKVIMARLFAENGKVYMEKTCPEHGYFKDLYWSDVDLYLKAEKWEFGDGAGLSNPITVTGSLPARLRHLPAAHEPHGPRQHRPDQPLQPDLPDLLRQRQRQRQGLRAEQGGDHGDAAAVPQGAAGGRPRRPVLRRRADHPPRLPRDPAAGRRDMGFSHIQIASNGIKFADPDFTRRAAEAGLHTIYLQFDGVDDHVYKQTRGRDLLENKLKAVETVRKAGIKIVYVPTIASGINEDQVGKILQFAIDNIDVSSGISYQPVAITGRVELRGAREAALHAAGPRALHRGADRAPARRTTGTR